MIINNYLYYNFTELLKASYSLPTVGLEPTTTRLKVLRSTN